MMPAVLVISVLWIIFIIYFIGLKLQLRSLRRQLESRISAPVKKPLAIEMQDNDLMAVTAALNQIFRQDEKFRQLQKRNENEYKDLITNISHDLRTPLTVLKGYLQLLERCEIDAAGKKYLSVCFRHTDELERRIRQFFEYSYWMNQEPEPQLKILNVTNLITNIMTDFIPMFEEKGLTMRLSPGAICKGLAEEELLQRVISITHDTNLPVHLPHNHTPGDFICICVQNPIAEDSELDPHKVFQRFYVERQERNQSTGLGLSIVKLLVEKMQGEVFAIRDKNLLRIGFYLRTGF